MTLDQAIDRYTNNAEYERRNGNLQGCMEFRQLAEWLKDYKRLLEQQLITTTNNNEPITVIYPTIVCDAISRENAIIQLSWDFPNLELPKIKESLDKLPSVNPQKYGEMLICPSCGLDVHSDFDYCPRCGAKMQGSEGV